MARGGPLQSPAGVKDAVVRTVFSGEICTGAGNPSPNRSLGTLHYSLFWQSKLAGSAGTCTQPVLVLSLRRDDRKEKKRQCLSCKGESIFRSTPRRSQLQIRHLVFVPKKSRRQPIRNDPWRHARTVRSRSSARVDSDHRVGPSRQDRCKKGKNELRRALTSAQPVWWSPRSTGSKKDIGSAD